MKEDEVTNQFLLDHVTKLLSGMTLKKQDHWYRNDCHIDLPTDPLRISSIQYFTVFKYPSVKITVKALLSIGVEPTNARITHLLDTRISFLFSGVSPAITSRLEAICPKVEGTKKRKKRKRFNTWLEKAKVIDLGYTS